MRGLSLFLTTLFLASSETAAAAESRDFALVPCAEASGLSCSKGWNGCKKFLYGDLKGGGVGNGAIQRIGCKVKGLVEGAYQGVSVDWSLLTEADYSKDGCDVTTPRGFASEVPVCSLSKNEYNSCMPERAEANNAKAKLKNPRCGDLTEMTIETEIQVGYCPEAFGIKVCFGDIISGGEFKRAVVDSTTGQRGIREAAWLRGARVQAFAYYKKQVIDEIARDHKLRLEARPYPGSQNFYCRPFLDKLNELTDQTSKAFCTLEETKNINLCQGAGRSSPGQSSRGSNATARSTLSASSFSDSAAIEDAEQKMGRQGACMLAQARDSVEAAFQEVAYCEIFYRAQSAYEQHFKDPDALAAISDRVKREVRDVCEARARAHESAARRDCTPGFRGDWGPPPWLRLQGGCSRSEIEPRCLSSGCLTREANQCYAEEIEKTVHAIIEERFPESATPCSSGSGQISGLPAWLFAGALGTGRRRRRRGPNAGNLDLVAGAALVTVLAFSMSCASGSDSLRPISCYRDRDANGNLRESGAGRCDGISGRDVNDPAYGTALRACCEPNTGDENGAGGYDPNEDSVAANRNSCNPEYRLKAPPPCNPICPGGEASCDKGGGSGGSPLTMTALSTMTMASIAGAQTVVDAKGGGSAGAGPIAGGPNAQAAVVSGGQTLGGGGGGGSGGDVTAQPTPGGPGFGRLGSNAGGGGGGGGGGSGRGGGLGSLSGNAGAAGAGGTTAQAKVEGDTASVAGAAYAGGGGGGGGGGGAAVGGLGSGIGGLFGGGGEGLGKAGATVGFGDGATSDGGSREATSGTEDPADYFTRTATIDNLFQAVSKKYEEKAVGWAKTDAQEATSAALKEARKP